MTTIKKSVKKILGMFVLSLPLAAILGAVATLAYGIKIGLLAATGGSIFFLLFAVCILLGLKLIDDS